MIDGLIRMMDTPGDFTGPVNLGNPAEVTMRELADLVIEQTGSNSQLTHDPLPADDPTQRRPDISLAKQKLSWEPTVPLAEGLRRTIDYFEKLLH